MSDWVEFNGRFSSYDKDAPGLEQALGNDHLAGLLIELDDGSQELIGSINTNGGVCDCCRQVTPSTVVRRYRRVFDWPIRA
jgi:hypothetical protein